MKLHRLALLSFKGGVPWSSQVKGNVGLVSFTTNLVTHKGEASDEVFLDTCIEIESPLTTDEVGYVQVPASERQQCEFVIEYFANRASILARTSRSISSPTPCIAFSELTAGQRALLESSKGINSAPRSSMRAAIPIDPMEPGMEQCFADRVDGMTFFAEAISNSHPVGRYRALMRFLENAFALPISGIEKKLNQLLQGADLGYSREEVREWLQLRNGAVHGNPKMARSYVIESDVAPLLERLEQACYDTMFNKKDWGSGSAERRSTLKHYVATTNRTGDLRATHGKELQMEVLVHDQFGSYPLHLAGVLTTLPECWWSGPSKPFEEPADDTSPAPL